MFAGFIETPLGSMLAVSDQEALHRLEFVENKNQAIKQLELKTKTSIRVEQTSPIESIRNELNLYFANKLTRFKTPLFLKGSDFQKKVWAELARIPHGKTCSYLDLAQNIKCPSAFRAVARANSTNPIAIVIPCHRVINHNGKLGGYAGGISKKEFLLEHEKK